MKNPVTEKQQMQARLDLARAIAREKANGPLDRYEAALATADAIQALVDADAN